MKKLIFMLVVAMLTIVGATHAQSSKNKKTEILYFKANLRCCRARACNALEADVKSVIEKYFSEENITFRTVKLTDAANKELVEKYNAKSQTVVILKKKKRRKKETVTDISAIVHDYAIKKDKEKFEKELKNKISECLK